MFKWLLLLPYVFLMACMMVGPDYKEPKKRVTAHWINKENTVKETPLQDAHWWSVFRDPTLTALIQQGYQNNLSLQSAAVRVLQTRAQLAQAVGAFYPQQQALNGNYTHQRIGGQSLQSVLPANFDTASLALSATWEIDFWGQYRRAILANDATFLASFAAYDNVLVTLTSDIALAYIEIRTTEALMHVVKENIKVQAAGLRIAKARYSAGQTSLLDVEQAQTELSQTEASLPDLVSHLRHSKDLLGVLLGTTPDKVDALLVKKQGIPTVPTTVAVGIPKETLAKRPDIYRARMEAIAQSETIGEIKANLFPAFSLTGTFGYASNNIAGNSVGSLFNWQNRVNAFGPAINWPILNYGQITNAVRAQDAVFQQAVLDYMNLVLKAQQEVQDHITQLIETKKAEKFLITGNQSAIKSTQLALIRYKEGESDFTPVLDSERQQLRVQKSLITMKGEVPKALVGLYRALGGGWQIRQGNDIVPKDIKAEMAARTYWGPLLNQPDHEPPKTKIQQLKDLYLPTW